MSATVIGCGSASHLMDVNPVKEHPQVHLHFLTDKAEAAELGYSKLELCCHGCGASLLTYFTESAAQRRALLTVKNEFVRTHATCKMNQDGFRHCANWRMTFEMVDIRKGVTPHPQEWQKTADLREKAVSPQ